MKDAAEVHFDGKIAQKVIVVRDNKVLLVQDPREGKEIWELPGGRMNEGEEPRAAMQREFLEEMGVAIKVYEVVHMEQFYQFSDGRNAFLIVYHGTLVDPQAPFVVADEEVSHVAWFTEEEVKALELFPEYQRALAVYFAAL